MGRSACVCVWEGGCEKGGGVEEKKREGGDGQGRGGEGGRGRKEGRQEMQGRRGRVGREIKARCVACRAGEEDDKLAGACLVKRGALVRGWERHFSPAVCSPSSRRFSPPPMTHSARHGALRTAAGHSGAPRAPLWEEEGCMQPPRAWGGRGQRPQRLWEHPHLRQPCAP